MNEKLINKIELSDIKKTMQAKGYKFFERGAYNLNLIGVRANRKDNINTDEFCDALVVIYNDDKLVLHKEIYPITTIPGKKYMLNPSNKKGVAILKVGQYPNVWKIDKHQGKYFALCQRGDKFVVYRDNNKDIKLDFDEATTEYGFFGINLHKAGENSNIVGAWSAGCQVMKRSADFNKVMALAEKAKNIYGNSFTYTLIQEDDLI